MFRARPLSLRIECRQTPSHIRVPIHSEHQNLCIHCTHFIHPTQIKQLNITDLKCGYCKHSGMVHLVDGSIEYENVSIYREYTCKGTFYDPLETDIKDVPST